MKDLKDYRFELVWASSFMGVKAFVQFFYASGGNLYIRHFGVWAGIICCGRQVHVKPVHEILVIITFASSIGSCEPVHQHRLVNTFAARQHKLVTLIKAYVQI